MLKDFSGVLGSDFYTAYDAIDCPQQKCLVHFIRDLNDDLLKHPYDDVLKGLGREFVYLVKPMIETVDHYGLKRRFLNKHRMSVDRFYRRLSDETGAGEVATIAPTTPAAKTKRRPVAAISGLPNTGAAMRRCPLSACAARQRPRHRDTDRARGEIERTSAKASR
jgi:hypothetical protein